MNAMKPPQNRTNSVFLNLLLIATYLVLHISLNLLNKWTMSYYGFGFPLLLSIAHMLFIFTTLLPVMLMKGFRETHSGTLRKQWLGLLVVGTLLALNIGFNKASLLGMSFSLSQVIRSMIPVLTALAAVVIESRPLTRKELLALLLLSLGVGISAYKGSDSKSSFQGVVLCLCGTVCHAIMMASSGKLLSADKVDVMRMTFYVSPVSCIVLSPFYMQMESASFNKYYHSHTPSYIGLLLVGCIVSMAYNMVHYLMIKHVSAVTTTVLMVALSASMLVGSEIWTFHMVVGVALAIVGFCMYSHCRLNTNVQWQPIIKGVPDLAPSLVDHTTLRSSLLALKNAAA